MEVRRYLFRIAINLLRDHLREPRATSLEDVHKSRFETYDDAAESESRALLGLVPLRMRPRERQFLWLAYAEGYTYRENGQITGLASVSIPLRCFARAAKLPT